MVFFESRKRIDAVAVILCISILAVVLGEFTATCTSIEEVKRRTESERSIRIRKDQAKRSLLDQRARLRSIRRFKPNEGAKGGLMPQVFFEEEHNDNEEIESESDRIVEGRSQHSTKKSKKSKVDKKTRKEKKSKKEKAKKNEHGGRMHAAVNSEEDDDDEHASGKASSFDGRGIISNNRPHSSLDNDRDEDIDIVVVNTTQIDEMSASEDGELVEKLRTIQLSHPEFMNDCVSYDSTMNQTVLFMSECSSTARNSRHPDHWEILPSTMDTNTTGQFHLRHEETQLCIPVNPETPELPFDCVRYFGMNEVLADSFNGLIECDSGFAAVFGILPSSNSLYLANTGCALNTESSEQEVIFMSYFNTIADRKVLVWGEEMLLELDSAIDDYQLENKWVFVDVDLLDRYEGVAVSRSEWSF